MLTHGAVGLAGEDVTDLAGAAVWGLVRSAQAEHPGRIVLCRQRWSDLMSACWPVWGSRRWWCAGTGVYAARLAVGAGGAGAAGGAGGGWVRVAAARWRMWWPSRYPEADAPLEAGQVRVAVAAVGVNFRDVLVALGMYPGAAAVLGAEGAGWWSRSVPGLRCGGGGCGDGVDGGGGSGGGGGCSGW